MTPLEQAAREYQDALAVASRARRLASRAQEEADKFIADADAAQRKAQDAKNLLLEAAEYHGRDF